MLDAGQQVALRHTTASQLVGQMTRGTYCKPFSSRLKKRFAGIVTLTSDGRAGAQNGSSECVMSRVGRMSRGASPQKPQTGAHDMRQMAAWVEVAMDECVSGQEVLGLLGRFKPLHLPLSASRRSV